MSTVQKKNKQTGEKRHYITEEMKSDVHSQSDKLPRHRRLCAVMNCSNEVWDNERNKEKETRSGVNYGVFYYCKEHSCKARYCRSKIETKRYCDEHHRAMNRRKRVQYQIKQQRLREIQRQEAEAAQERLQEQQREVETVHALQHLIELDDELTISRRNYCEQCGKSLQINAT